ncbi:hypothetical protein KCP76_20485 [Salmonella enterica subsp. enterica serovar Weltevreden]|nr:hypothetical protein KCP76_20485 [Salmonella enterica subsp. enterica serovar Weltevreden]
MVIQLDVHWEDHPNYPSSDSRYFHNEIRLVLHKLREKEQFKFTTFDDVDDSGDKRMGRAQTGQ